MHLNYKATIWFRVPIENKEALDHVKKIIEEGFNPQELYHDIPFEANLGSCETIYDTEDFMETNFNKNDPTVEILKSNGETVWDNSALNTKDFNKIKFEE